MAGKNNNKPEQPLVSAKANYEKASLDSGTISVSIKSAEDTFAWNVYLDNKVVERWQIPENLILNVASQQICKCE